MPLRGLRVVATPDLGDQAAVDEDILAAFENVMRRLEEKGAWVVRDHPRYGERRAMVRVVGSGDRYATHGHLLESDEIEPATRAYILAGKGVSLLLPMGLGDDGFVHRRCRVHREDPNPQRHLPPAPYEPPA